MCNGWEFFYDGWKDENPLQRSKACATNRFPKERKGRLDYDLLKKLQLTKKRIIECDALFFKQLLRPMCDPKKSGIIDDPRMLT